MFSKSHKSTAEGLGFSLTERRGSTTPSIISADLKITGNLTSDGEIQVDGAVRGDIRCKNLLVGEGADIQGEIIAETVMVHGAISGLIKGRSVTLSASAKVDGDIFHEDIAIEKGAHIMGGCKPTDFDATLTGTASEGATPQIAQIGTKRGATPAASETSFAKGSAPADKDADPDPAVTQRAAAAN